MIEPRIELGTFCVLSRCHNQLDHPTICEGPSRPDHVEGKDKLCLHGVATATATAIVPPDCLLVMPHLRLSHKIRPVIWQFVRAVKEKD